VLVGPETGDDAGVYRLGEHALVATADFITPTCDDPRRFGRIAATNSLSDVWAMGGRPLFALNLCCFPRLAAPPELLSEILLGAAEVVGEAGAVVLGGHSVTDAELKFGLAVVGLADPARLLVNSAARPGDRLLLTKPLGTGVLINAYKAGRAGEAELEPALVEMERSNEAASRLALEHGVLAATDVTGFGLAGHALAIARASGVGLRVRWANLPLHPRFLELAAAGVSTGCTGPNRSAAAEHLDDRAGLDETQATALWDPQTSGGLLLAAPPERAADLLAALLAGGHGAAEIGEVVAPPVRLEVV
jgi:selenide,water dikinase